MVRAGAGRRGGGGRLRRADDHPAAAPTVRRRPGRLHRRPRAERLRHLPRRRARRGPRRGRPRRGRRLGGPRHRSAPGSGRPRPDRARRPGATLPLQGHPARALAHATRHSPDDTGWRGGLHRVGRIDDTLQRQHRPWLAAVTGLAGNRPGTATPTASSKAERARSDCQRWTSDRRRPHANNALRLGPSSKIAA
ncbi:hypothetical protein FRACA_3210005 [Frankia canadensis]|uniref:Uncharacterized protein n=1 Tax=Frankia canadensis TaxID=1836972 RepID=A0A2I2KUM7_9ACTN|nr:hypothetical protein FRACA_3210005 [Frankia canadensis]SOU56656.1 hypothetical protein FRACA_3210005 [Frankia canadensis]